MTDKQERKASESAGVFKIAKTSKFLQALLQDLRNSLQLSRAILVFPYQSLSISSIPDQSRAILSLS